jgi:D-tagatose-1,6-bisphosphate aldolase subunit GatZ/KbaZ
VRALLEIVRRHRAGEHVGIYSVCSAHPMVLRASLQHARARGGYALIEATSNQVNQEGGYTGLRPAQFRDLVWGLADDSGLPRDRVLLGGDHLGPNAWQSLPADDALRRAGVMVREYVRAGYRPSGAAR